MKGGEIHECIIRRLEAEFRDKGFRTAQQVPARSGRHVGFVDLMAENPAGQIVCVEVEMSARRVPNDIVKAVCVSALVANGRLTRGSCVLWIVVPSRRVKDAVRATLDQRTVDAKLSIFLLTYGEAMARLRNNLPLSFEAMPEEKRKSN